MSKSINFKQRWLPLVLVPLFSVSVLAGCSSDDDDADPMVTEEEEEVVIVDPDAVVGDADGNDIPDAFETLDTAADADGNGIADVYQTAADGSTTDSNGNGIDDSYEAALTSGTDANADGVDDAADPNAPEETIDPDETETTEVDQTGPLDVPLADAGTAALNWDGFNLTGQINIDGLPDGVGPAQAGLYTGISAAGTGQSLVTFNGDGNPTYFMPTPLAADQQATVAENIVNGNLFVRVDLSDGTSRNGIILLPGVTPKFSEISAANSVPAGEAFSTGGGFINLNTVTGDFAAVVNVNLNASDVDADGNSQTITAAHIHAGAADENGDVIVGLEDAGNGSSWTATGTFTADELATVMEGGSYFNVHGTDGNGFMRGQITAF